MDPVVHYAFRTKLMSDVKVKAPPRELGAPHLARYTLEAGEVRQVVQHMPYQSDTEAQVVVEMVLDHLVTIPPIQQREVQILGAALVEKAARERGALEVPELYSYICIKCGRKKHVTDHTAY